MRYSQERKNGALAMMAEHGTTYTSEQLGIHETTLNRWRREETAAKTAERVATSEEVQAATEEVCQEEAVQPESVPETVNCQGSSITVQQAIALLEKPKDIILGEISLLLSENELLKTQNDQLRRALQQIIA